MISRIRKTTGLAPTLVNLPVEILDNIAQFLPQSALFSLLLTNSNFIEVAACYLYMAPEFASTFRYAQFAHQVSHKPYYADLVRDLDMSYFNALGRDNEGDLEPMAGWREFKYRNVPDVRLYYGPGLSRKPQRGWSHPYASADIRSFNLTRDVPIGALCHALAACKKIR